MFAQSLIGWQDDVDVFLQDPVVQFPQEGGFGFLSGASSQLRIGRYLVGDENHASRGGVEADVSLLNFGDSTLWHAGINVETLIDDLNDIKFRLVQVYYQVLTGIKWKLGSGVLHTGLRHRCSHGVDGAVDSRILIRSGLTASYQWEWLRPKFKLDVMPGMNIYLLGQNKDLNTQQRGNLFATAQTAWLITGPAWFVIAAGAHLEMVGRGDNWVFGVNGALGDWYLQPLFAGRVAVRFERGRTKSEIGWQFSQILDSGFGERAIKSTNLSMNVDFAW